MAMTDANECWFVDTNVLVYASDEQSPFHSMACACLEAARAGGAQLCISPQVIREYISAATRSTAAAGRIPWALILENCTVFQRDFRVLAEDERTVSTLCEILATVPAVGKQVHDANIVATMVTHGVALLCTFNTADFERYRGFISLVPTATAS